MNYWSSGSVTGLCAHGGCQIDLTWDYEQLEQATIHSQCDATCTVKAEVFALTSDLSITNGSQSIPYTLTADTLTFQASSNQTYTLTAKKGRR